jgi:hypothetical protein
MADIRVSELDKTEIVGQFKMVQCRHAEYTKDDVTGEIFGGKKYRRHVIAPGDDTTGEPAETIAICNAVHTPAVVDAYKAFLAEQETI